MAQKDATWPERNPFIRARAQIRSLTDVAFQALWEAILSGHLPPNQRLSEREISRQLGMSPTPVKEALQRLAYEGFVTIEPRRGTRVAEAVATPLHEICAIRAALEGVGAKFAADKASGAQLAAFRAQLRLMHRCTNRDYDVDALHAANTQFHELVYATAGNPYITRLLTALRFFTTSIRRRALSDIQEARRGLREHRSIYEAIASHDPEMARARMEAHIMRTIEFVVTTRPAPGEGSGTADPVQSRPGDDRRLSVQR